MLEENIFILDEADFQMNVISVKKYCHSFQPECFKTVNSWLNVNTDPGQELGIICIKCTFLELQRGHIQFIQADLNGGYLIGGQTCHFCFTQVI